MQPAPFFSLRLSVAAGWPLPSRTCAPPAPGHPRCSRAARTLLSVPSSELRPPDFSPAIARSPLRRCPAVGTGPRAQGPEPVFCSAYGHAGGDEPGQKPRAETQGRDQTWSFLAPQEGSREDSRARAARVAADGRRATCADSPRAPEPQRPRARRGSAVGGLGSPFLRPGAPCSAELPAGSRALPPPLISLFKAARGGRGAPSARFTVENRDT